ncbi:hypothetical protein D3C71_1568530 [compost metagenome]
MLRTVGAVIFPTLVDVLAEGTCLILGLWKNRECTDTFAAGFGSAGRRSGVKHALDDRGVLLAIAADTELTTDVDSADGGDGLDAVVCHSGGDHIAARGTDAQRADAVRVDPALHTEE